MPLQLRQRGRARPLPAASPTAGAPASPVCHGACGAASMSLHGPLVSLRLLDQFLSDDCVAAVWLLVTRAIRPVGSTAAVHDSLWGRAVRYARCAKNTFPPPGVHPPPCPSPPPRGGTVTGWFQKKTATVSYCTGLDNYESSLLELMRTSFVLTHCTPKTSQSVP